MRDTVAAVDWDNYGKEAESAIRAAATGAGLRCLVTVNGYTRDEDFGEAVLVVSELGDPDRPGVEVLANRSKARPGTYLTLDDLRACLEGSA